jgi:hypothetical protein
MVPLFIFLILYFKGIKSASVTISSTIRNQASWSDRLLTIAGAQKSVHIALSTKILLMDVLEEC